MDFIKATFDEDMDSGIEHTPYIVELTGVNGGLYYDYYGSAMEAEDRVLEIETEIAKRAKEARCEKGIYRVIVEQVLAKEIEVEATSDDDALEQVQAMFDRDEILLTSDDFDGNTEMKVMEE